MNTNLSRQNPMSLLIALDQNQTASGSLFWDDGDSVDTYENQNYNLFQFNYTNNNTITITAVSYRYQTSLVLNQIQVYGLAAQPTQIMLMDSNSTAINMTWNATSNVLQISNITLNMTATTCTLMVSHDNTTSTTSTMATSTMATSTMATSTIATSTMATSNMTTTTTTRASAAVATAPKTILLGRLVFILFLFFAVFY
jgi:hypothetical protein